MPRPKKPAGTAVDRRNGAKVAALPTGGQVEQFKAPRGLSMPARRAWEDFWSDRQSQLLTPSSRTVLLRWIDALDRYLRTTAEADREPLVSGSTGQLVVNPLYKIADSARSVMEACERQLGIGGINAANLGLAAIAEAKSLADMNAKYAEPGGGDDDSDADDDPRTLRVVDL